MPIKNKIHLKRYVLGTILNFGSLFFALGVKNIDVLLVFMLCILLNQLFLLIFGIKLLNIEKFDFFIPTPLLIIFKLLLLGIAFYYGYIKVKNMIIFLVISYIFQLIILTISTKRIVKKN